MANTKNKRRIGYFHYQKEILNTISEPASFINRKYCYVFVNSAFNNFYDIETRKIIGKSFADFWGPEKFESKIKPSMDKCLEMGDPVFIEYEGIIPTGESKIIELNFYPHHQSNGKIDGIIALTKDITEQKLAEKKLIESEARLKELNNTKDKLFSIIGHDLKGPLNNILGFSELIQEGNGNLSMEKILKYNQLIYQLSKNVSELLDNLLTWSRTQREKVEVDPQELSLHIIVERCFSLLNQDAVQKNIILNNEVSSEAMVFADEKMVTTVIRNLVSNSIKFTERGGEIFVRSEKINNSVTIEIRDTGIGIEENKLNNLFTPDVNHSSIGTEGEKGTGLGLLICKDFTEKNNGKIWVESVLGEGTSFFITLPTK